MDEKLPLPMVLVGNAAAQVLWEAGLRGPELCTKQSLNRSVRECQRAVDIARQEAKKSFTGLLRHLLENDADLEPPPVVIRAHSDQAAKLRSIVESRRREEEREKDRANRASDEEMAALRATNPWRAQKIAQIAPKKEN